ncbi:S-adenosyl-L-methionine-dependent methyltransferase [Biscogniauxia marginata]|nr:S-adenosyl-L-methionine-dependent methyltransferase [Biscogniauxia marginata]
MSQHNTPDIDPMLDGDDGAPGRIIPPYPPNPEGEARSGTNSSVASFGNFSAGAPEWPGTNHSYCTYRLTPTMRDNDSAMFDVDRESSSMSVSSSVFNFVEEHGRTYHWYKEGRYWMPNDEHIICLKVFRGQLALAPVKNPARVLDFGTGTGIWAIEFAIENPGSDVLGTDLSPIQPELKKKKKSGSIAHTPYRPCVPPNCRFEVEDVEDEWGGGSSRTSSTTSTRAAHARVGPTARSRARALRRWNDALERALALAVRTGAGCARSALPSPGNPWPRGEAQKELGALQMRNILEGIHGMSMTLLTKMLGMRAEEVEALLVEVRKDLQNRNIHFYYPI